PHRRPCRYRRDVNFNFRNGSPGHQSGKRIAEHKAESLSQDLEHYESGSRTLPGYILNHCSSEQSIDSGLITLTLLSKPGDHIGVEPNSELTFYRPVEGIPHSVFPKAISERRNVGI